MKLTLISFKLCPFVQRSVITLIRKNIDFDIEYIDLANKPDWFLKISPLGKVPTLKINGDVLFESAVINEYLDETTSPHYLPEDPLERAKERAWIEVASQTIFAQYKATMAKTKADHKKHAEDYFSKLERLNEVTVTPYFSGTDFTLMDAAAAPIFMRHRLTPGLKDDPRWKKLENLQKWAQTLSQEKAVKESVVDDFPKLFEDSLKKNEAFVAS